MAVDRFLALHEVPIVEGRDCSFLVRGEADEVRPAQRILGLPSRLPTRRIRDDVVFASLSRCPTGSRINYQVQVSRGHHIEQFNDPLNPKLSRSPFGTSSAWLASGYTTPEWTMPDHDGHAHSPIVDRYLSTENRRPCCPSPSTRPGSF
jgi:hypothetical protein